MYSSKNAFEQNTQEGKQDQLYKNFKAHLEQKILFCFLNNCYKLQYSQVFKRQNEIYSHLSNATKIQFNENDKTFIKDQQRLQIDKNMNQVKTSQGVQNKSRKNLYKNQLKNLEQDSDYLPQESEIKQKQIYFSTTKNAIRNFSRWVLSYVLENRKQTDQVLKSCKVQKEFFYQFATKQKNNVTNMKSLKSLWKQQSNSQFAKAMRIIFFNFIRKHYFHKTFHSKTRFVSRNLKYKKKLQKILKNPDNSALFQAKQI